MERQYVHVLDTIYGAGYAFLCDVRSKINENLDFGLLGCQSAALAGSNADFEVAITR